MIFQNINHTSSEKINDTVNLRKYPYIDRTSSADYPLQNSLAVKNVQISNESNNKGRYLVPEKQAFNQKLKKDGVIKKINSALETDWYRGEKQFDFTNQFCEGHFLKEIDLILEFMQTNDSYLVR